MTAELIRDIAPSAPRPVDLASWRSRLDRDQIPPVIAVAGTRGKTSVVRAVESILRAGEFRFASWTNRGVEIEGENQSGELGPWSRALTRLAAGGLDVALQEIDWTTVQAMGKPATTYPVVAIANLCANSDACLLNAETHLARKALARIRAKAATQGKLVLNADDLAVVADEPVESAGRYLVGISSEAPALRRHVAQGGDACWLEGSTLTVHEDDHARPVVDVRWLNWTRGGAIPFAVQTALLAAAVARSCGVPDAIIAAGLASHDPRPESMPGSFNVFEIDSSTIVIDRPVPPWFLRSSLRASANFGPGRNLRIAGPMSEVAASDLQEVGRLLGRDGGILIAHGRWSEERLDLLRQGASGNRVPPIFLQATDERSAIQQGISLLRPGDVMFILAENAPAVVRLIGRRVRRSAGLARETAGAA